MQLFIKNMVCNRCIKVVNDELKKLGYTIIDIELGRVELKESLSINELNTISKMLVENGFELLEDSKKR
jgi:copper chaperone CopZ